MPSVFVISEAILLSAVPEGVQQLKSLEETFQKRTRKRCVFQFLWLCTLHFRVVLTSGCLCGGASSVRQREHIYIYHKAHKIHCCFFFVCMCHIYLRDCSWLMYTAHFYWEWRGGGPGDFVIWGIYLVRSQSCAVKSEDVPWTLIRMMPKSMVHPCSVGVPCTEHGLTNSVNRFLRDITRTFCFYILVFKMLCKQEIYIFGDQI